LDSPTLPTPESTPEPAHDDPQEVEIIDLSENEDEDIVEEDEPIPPLGWTTKVWYKPGCEYSVSHHRLLSLLQTYYSDWDAAVEYACEEHAHPLEDTYWKVRVCITIKDEQKDAYQLDSNYAHHGHRATMEDSIEDAAAEACIGLRGRRFEDMKDEQYRFLPHQHLELGWAMMDPQGTDPTTEAMVHFGYESVSRIHRLENQLKAHQKTIKRHRQVIDKQRVCLNLPKMYEELPHKYRP